MREARIILATETRHNHPIKEGIRGLLRAKLTSAFSGYTETQGTGGYVMADGSHKRESVYVYDVGMEDHQYPTLTAIAQWLALVADQECVYVRRPDGEVLFYNRGL